MKFTQDDLDRQFTAETLEQGREIVDAKLVRSIRRSVNLVRSEVRDLNSQTLHVQNTFIKSTTSGFQFQGTCSCEDVLNCPHVAAVLLTLIDEKKKKSAAQAAPLAAWIEKLRESVADAGTSGHPAASPSIAFVVSPDASGRRLYMRVAQIRFKPGGELSSVSQITDPERFLADRRDLLDGPREDMLRQFVSLKPAVGPSHTIEPRGRLGASLMQNVLASGLLYFSNTPEDISRSLVFPVEKAPQKEAALKWHKSGSTLKLMFEFVEGIKKGRKTITAIDYIVPTSPAYYISNLSCGLLVPDTKKPFYAIDQVYDILHATPPISSKDGQTVSRLILEKGLSVLMDGPEPLKERLIEDVEPVPVLSLSSRAQDAAGAAVTDVAKLSFDYDGIRVDAFSSLPPVRTGKDGIIEHVLRNELSEDALIETLRSFGLDRNEQGELSLATPTEWLSFTKNALPFLAEENWIIEKAKSFRYDVSPITGWYAELEAGEGPNPETFTVEIGLTVKRKKYPAFPVISGVIAEYSQLFDYKALEKKPSGELPVTLPDGVRVAIPWKILRAVVRIFSELTYTTSAAVWMELHRLDCARLAEIDGEMKLKWSGDLQFLEMGKKLLSFNGVTRVDPPKSLKGVLRDYQVDGLSWMQFLREYRLAGILADDMGLGKTLQTLAHIQLEKEAGRLTKPALIVAPTSLMGNWFDEAARFTPELKVLILQGKDRAQNFSQITEHDIVLTTYALLPRDEDILLSHEFHLLILDESQFIKNIRSKASQIASLLNARHKLCLTGTPLENHLGELWSQFHFLLPGLLGTERAFNNEFRHVIEKTGDQSRQALLNRRIRPFLLRRTKDKVAKELPMKTEIVRYVELGQEQRDIYETVRDLMYKRVSEDIETNGIAHAQIMILEALLKLRQICCDPRLLTNLPNMSAPSAKLDHLTEMVTSLLQEGRKILIFSQFTSMLGLIENELLTRSIPYALLTGDTADRASEISCFQNGEVSVFLISLKAGGTGLNLTAADTVIHYDPWWNPAVENQATDRAWRIGQDKPVFVYRLIARGTLEEHIQGLQLKKARLAEALLSSAMTGRTQITQKDLKVIFAPISKSLSQPDD